MQLELRQHEDGSYTLEVRSQNEVKEIDLTQVVREIVVDKLRALQTRLRLEENYRLWSESSNEQTQRAVSTTIVRYQQMQNRLTETNEAITEAVDAWRKQKDLQGPMMRLTTAADKNAHMMETDRTLQLLEELSKKG